MFAENLKQLRKSKNLTQKQLAELFDYSHVAVAKWENGSREPDFKNLTKLAEYFEVSIDYLWGHTTKFTQGERQIDEAQFNKILKEYGDLFEDEYFLQTVKLYKKITPEERSFCFGYLTGILQKHGVDVNHILNQ